MHTPGPWSRYGNVVVGPHGETIVTAHKGMSFDIEANDLSEGNAALATAAPDMLEVLETTRGNIVSLRNAGLPGPLEEWLRVVEETIALATA